MYYKSQSRLMVVLSIFPEFFSMSTIQAFFSLPIIFLFHIFIFHINIVSFIFFDYRQSMPPFCLHCVKCSPVNIVPRKINWQKPSLYKRYQINRNSLTMKNLLKVVCVYVGGFVKLSAHVWPMFNCYSNMPLVVYRIRDVTL